MNYNQPFVRRSFFVAFGALILFLMIGDRALADGAYQRTDDRKKTIVWNNDPQPGDAAEWTGGRDSEGYADGTGTLTWLRAQQAFATGSNIPGTKKVPISRISGTMVHGKFVGVVTTIDHRKTYYAKYVDGQRKGDWSSTPLVAKTTSIGAKTESELPKKAPKITAAEKVETPAEPKVSEAEPEPPTEGPDEAEAAATVGSQRSQVSASSVRDSDKPLGTQSTSALIAQASEADESATPRQQPVTKKSALAPGAVHAIEKPGQPAEKKSSKPKEAKVTKTPNIQKPKPEATIAEREAESPAEGPLSAGPEKPQSPTPKSEIVPSQPSSPSLQPSLQETPADDSIRTLTGPPSSLRTRTPEPEISIAPASSASAEPKLNTVQAMDIADIEARTKGYDLGEYQLPKAEYNASNDTWSVSYIARDKEKNPNGLHVTIQDKNGKAEVRK